MSDKKYRFNIVRKDKSKDNYELSDDLRKKIDLIMDFKNLNYSQVSVEDIQKEIKRLIKMNITDMYTLSEIIKKNKILKKKINYLKRPNNILIEDNNQSIIQLNYTNMNIDHNNKRYRKKKDEVVRNFRCNITQCGKSYGSENSLYQHIKIKHIEFWNRYGNYGVEKICHENNKYQYKSNYHYKNRNEDEDYEDYYTNYNKNYYDKNTYDNYQKQEDYNSSKIIQNDNNYTYFKNNEKTYDDEIFIDEEDEEDTGYNKFLKNNENFKDEESV